MLTKKIRGPLIYANNVAGVLSDQNILWKKSTFEFGFL
jgi:hypothetical protein